MSKDQVSPNAPLAIVGLACRFPKANNSREYWSNILNGVDCITEVPESHWRPEDYFDEDPKKPDFTYARRGGFISPVPFNPLEFGVPPKAIEATDTSQLLGMVVAKEALADAGYGSGGRSFDKSRVSVILGVTGALELVIPLGARLGHPLWRRALADAGVSGPQAEAVMDNIAEGYVPWQEQSFPGLLGNVVAGRIANYLDLGGTNCVVDAACASALSALHLAGLELLSGRSDMVLTGGIDTFNDIFMYMCFSKTPALSPSGDARPFDRDSDGTILGEGLGIVALKRLADAEADGDKIYAVLRGIGSSSDGKGNAIYAPSDKGQSKALRRAYENAQVTPATVEMVECHGTGTKVGDATELRALGQVYGGEHKTGPWCAVGSVKSQIGHAKAAAGIAGLIKATMSLNHKVLPPTIKVKNPSVDAASGPFFINAKAKPWMPVTDHPRRAGVSAFGFGGSNFHCVLEEYRPAKMAVDWDGTVQILAFSASSREDLAALVGQMPAEGPWADFEIYAAQSRLNFNAGESFRLLLVIEKERTERGRIKKNALTLMDKFSSEPSWNAPEGIYFGSGTKTGKLGVLFPGQGSQYVGMLRDLACRFPQMQAALCAVDRAFQSSEGFDEAYRLTDLIYPPSAFEEEQRNRQEHRLTETQNAQPAIGAVSIGALKVLDVFGVKAETAAGHSYGEVTALCASERFDMDALYLLSRLRGQLMAQGDGDRGAMVAVRAPVSVVEVLIKDNRLDLVLANKNAPDQVVLSGATREIERVLTILDQQNISNKRLPVAAAFHSTLVANAGEPFSMELQKIDFPKARIPVYSNTTAKPYPEDGVQAKQLLATQLMKPVAFVDEIENMYGDDVRVFLEVGPGARLTGLVKSILAGRKFDAMAVDASFGKRSGGYDLAKVLAQLSSLGYALNLDLWEESRERAKIKPPIKGMIVPLSGANHRERKPVKKAVALAKPAVSATFPQKTRRLPTPPPQSSRVDELGSAVSNTTPKDARLSVSPSTPSVSVPGQGHRGSLSDAFRMTQQNLQTLQKIQEDTASLHRKFLEGQEDALNHLSLLLQQQRLLLGGGEPGSIQPQSASKESRPVGQTQIQQPAMPSRSPVVGGHAVQGEASKPATSEAANLPSSGELNPQLLLEIVGEKTGYPLEMLEMDMTLDADLGIDSIKRVEILSALQEAVPGLPAVEPDQIGGLVSLQDIWQHISAETVTKTSHKGPEPDRSSPAPKDLEIQALLLEIVAEKTGYPVKMLDPTMSLDGDLGIDSIKRVEILSALQEARPELPQMKPEDLGRFHALGDIVSHLKTAGAENAAPTRGEPRTGGPALSGLLLEIVAEKTGYPIEMLAPEMSLDADLGIDSIKRVEILAALQDRAPHLPAIAPDQMSRLHRLADIIDYLEPGQSVGLEPLSQPKSHMAVLLQVVAEKTGYPVDMLEPGMDLDADLGIDSIKRVEIFSSLQELLPGLPEVKPDRLSTFQSLAQIAAFLGAEDKETPAEVPPAVAGEIRVEQIRERLLQVVSEKTGYPADILNFEMGLESELGIDSIKRVEILSTLQESIPGLPELSPDQVGLLGNLNDVVALFTASRQQDLPAPPAAAKAEAGEPEPAADHRSLLRSLPRLSPLSMERSRRKPAPGSDVWIVDGGPLSRALASACSEHGLRPVMIDLAADFISELEGKPAGLVLFPCGDADRYPKQSLKLLQRAASALRRTPESFLVSVTGLGGDFGLNGLDASADPISGALCGLVKTASREWPEVACKTIDTANLQVDSGAVLLAEILKDGPLEVALIEGAVSGIDLEECPTPQAEGTDPLVSGDVVLVSGGARGVTAEVAVSLAHAFRPTLLLLGRSASPEDDEPEWSIGVESGPSLKKLLLGRLPEGTTPRVLERAYRRILAEREMRCNMARMREAGAVVHYFQVDLVQTEAVAAFVSEARDRFGGLHGLVHGAGVLADKTIEDKTEVQFDQVFGTKVAGLSSLLTAMSADDLKILVMFSSSTARFGRKGQVDYAMANEVLNKMAQQQKRLRPAARVLSINWGPWDGGMVTPALVKMFATEGVGLIPPRVGGDYLVEELRGPRQGPVEVVILGQPSAATPLSPGLAQPAREVSSDREGFNPAYRVALDLDQFPFLKSHVIHHKPVLPVAMIAEWMGHAALHEYPGYRFFGLEGLRVTKGVMLEHGEPLPLVFHVGKFRREDQLVRVPVQLRGGEAGERLHAQGEVLMADRLPKEKPKLAPPNGKNLALTPAELYERLFHGPHFQGLRAIESCGPDGLVAFVKGSLAPKDMIAKPQRGTWLTDPPILDCAFQAAIIWCLEYFGKPSLPTFFGAYHQFGRFPAEGARIVMRVVRQNQSTLVAHMEFLDPQSGVLIARLTDYECVMDKNLQQAFEKNQVNLAIAR